MKNRCRLAFLSLVGISLNLLSPVLYGQTEEANVIQTKIPELSVDQDSSKDIITNPKKLTIQEDVTLRYSYVGESKLKSGASGDMGEQTAQFGYGLKIPLNTDLSLRVGLNYSRLDFGQPEGSFLPDSLETLSTSLGADYKIDSEWGVFGVIAPRLSLVNGWDSVDSENFDISGAVGASYEVNKDLSLRFGLGINPGTSSIPVLPIVGVRWKFEKDWTLNLGFPRTAIDYQLLPNLRLTPIELGFEGGSFHTGKTYGDSVGMPQLNNQKLDYTEVRVGIGASYTVVKNVDIGLSAGVVAYRQFDFKNADYSPEVDPAPYVQIGARVGF